MDTTTTTNNDDSHNQDNNFDTTTTITTKMNGATPHDYTNQNNNNHASSSIPIQEHAVASHNHDSNHHRDNSSDDDTAGENPTTTATTTSNPATLFLPDPVDPQLAMIRPSHDDKAIPYNINNNNPASGDISSPPDEMVVIPVAKEDEPTTPLLVDPEGGPSHHALSSTKLPQHAMANVPDETATTVVLQQQQPHHPHASPLATASSPQSATSSITTHSAISNNNNNAVATAPAVPTLVPLLAEDPPSTTIPARSSSNHHNNHQASPAAMKRHHNNNNIPLVFSSSRWYARLSQTILKEHYHTPLATATWLGFWALSHVTCANHVLTPMRDAIALQIGVEHMPKLTLVSTALAFCSSVPIGWLFEAPDPSRRRLWKRMGLTRGETQGTSLALFYRFFAFLLVSYAVAFEVVEWSRRNQQHQLQDDSRASNMDDNDASFMSRLLQLPWLPTWLVATVSQTMYIAFFLVVHLMKLHSISLMWGVTTEAMEYEDVARKRLDNRNETKKPKTRFQRMALVSFGGTVGGILGSLFTSCSAQMLRLSGLLLIAAILLEVSAELSIELGRVMQKHWEEQQLFPSTTDLASLDTSMKRSASLGSMKRVASGNSLNRVRSASELSTASDHKKKEVEQEDNTFFQRLFRGGRTILSSRLLMAIFTYNSLYASSTVLLSFQRAELIANRTKTSSVQQDTAFLANINMASSVAVFAFQATGLGAFVASTLGSRGTLSLMPVTRLSGVLWLAWWHKSSNGQPPNLLVFLAVDEFCKIMNMAVAKPVRESLWRGLSNEARYEAKPIVDTLANRWGGGSAAFLVSFLHRTLDLFGVPAETADRGRTVLGVPPIVFLCSVIAAWWAVVSADLGQIRHSIDLELKKRQ